MKALKLSFRQWLLVAALQMVVPGCAWAQHSDLGQIDFPNSGAAPAQVNFLRGVLLLHSFEYEDAAEEFRQAQTQDPNFGLAYWGEAMTYNHPIWMQVNVEQGRAALNRLAPTAEARADKVPTPREKDYLHAVEFLYGEGDKEKRDFAYAEAMRRLTEKYPDDLEAAAFYALSLLGTCHNGRDFATYMKAAAVAQRVFEKNPNHPGAAHYLIHSFDDPIHAPLGLPMAQVYAKIAPAAAHALHMPSHIFFALGMWDEAAASNEESWAASEARRKRKNLPLTERGYHALLWQEYAYLQQGRFGEAKTLLELMAADAKQSDARRIRFHCAAMRAAYVIDTQTWDSEAARMVVHVEDLEKDTRAGDLFVQGMCAVKTGENTKAEKILATMEALQPQLVAQTGSAGMGMTDAQQCHAVAGTASSAYPAALPAGAIMTMELKALIQMQKGQAPEALQLLQQATAAEDRMTFEFGPPVVVKPTHELRGELLLAQNRPQEAQAEFKLALQRAPNRLRSLVGLQRAAAQAGDTAQATEAQASLKKILHRADADWAGLAPAN